MTDYVVVDSNVYISALVYGGTPEDALAYAVRESVLIGSAYIWDEIRRVLTSKKFGWDAVDIENALGLYQARVLEIDYSEIKAEVRDTRDIPILACALAAQADYLITGDQDLLVLKRYHDIRIVTPRVFLEEVLS